MSVIPVKAKWATEETKTNEAGDEVFVYASAELEFDFGENTADAVARFGEDAVFASYVAQAKVQLQGAIRAQGEAGVSSEEIPSRLASWAPGTRLGRVAVDPIEALKAQYAAADEGGKEALLLKIMGEEAKG